MKTLTPYGFARRECANFYDDAECIGFPAKHLIDYGQQKYIERIGRCLCADEKRCYYFEEIILPIADFPSPVNEPRMGRLMKECRLFYYTKHNLVIPPAMKIRECECGNELEKGKRLCHVCCKKHRKETYNRSQQKKRMSVNS